MKDILEMVYSSSDMQAKNRVIAILANAIDRGEPNDGEKDLALIIRGALTGRHFDKTSADRRVSRIYYVSEDGVVIHAPFVSEAKNNELYEEYKKYIAGYNAHDFYVVLNDTIANFHKLFHAWWYNEEEELLLNRYCEVAVNWLDDDDTQYHGEKAWRLLSEEK